MAKQYRCYLLGADGQIISTQIVECDDDAAALLEADRLLESSPDALVEVWNGARKVSILSRNEQRPKRNAMGATGHEGRLSPR
jgi:hypothetical protein